jgi:hypothetical protein
MHADIVLTEIAATKTVAGVVFMDAARSNDLTRVSFLTISIHSPRAIPPGRSCF